MPFGYEYWMVYLPEVNAESFLLFTHNPKGQTRLRDYSSGSERILRARVSVEYVWQRTKEGRTRFYNAPHITSGSGAGHWHGITAALNQGFPLEAPRAQESVIEAPSVIVPSGSTRSRARRGSRRQLQDYVNGKAEALTAAVLAALPGEMTESGADIRWTSPLDSLDYEEYRDAAFLSALEIKGCEDLLADFWPSMGPSWDALGILASGQDRAAILVEAKSHIPEIYGGGCQAGPVSLAKIDRALNDTKSWLMVSNEANWTGELYQYANRLAHLYFLLEKARMPAWLVNLYFLDDPIGPTTEEQWKAEISQVKTFLKLPDKISNAIDVFVPVPPTSMAPSGAHPATPR